MTKGSLPMIAAINALLAIKMAGDREAVAKEAIDRAENEFIKDCEREIELLQDRRAILVQQKAEHVFEPPKSEIMRLKLAVKTANKELAEAIEQANDKFVSNFVEQAMSGSVNKESFKVLHRLQAKDYTLEPLQKPYANLKRAEEALNAIVEDSEVEEMDDQIEAIDAEIAQYQAYLK